MKTHEFTKQKDKFLQVKKTYKIKNKNKEKTIPKGLKKPQQKLKTKSKRHYFLQAIVTGLFSTFWVLSKLLR